MVQTPQKVRRIGLGDAGKSSPDLPGRVSLMFFIVIAIVPMVFGIGYALSYSVGLSGLLSEGFSLQAWSAAMCSGELLRSLSWSLYLAMTILGAVVVLALGSVWKAGKHLDGRVVNAVMLVPVTIPAIVSGFLVLQLFSDAGLAARWLVWLDVAPDVESVPSLVHDAMGIGIVVAHVFIAAPWFALVFRQIQVGERLDRLEEVARNLGGGTMAVLFRVTVPVILNRAAPLLVLYFIAVFGSYEIPLLLGRQAPEMISVLTMRKFSLFDLSQRPDAFVAALMYTLVSSGILLIAARRGWLTR